MNNDISTEEDDDIGISTFVAEIEKCLNGLNEIESSSDRIVIAALIVKKEYIIFIEKIVYL